MQGALNLQGGIREGDAASGLGDPQSTAVCWETVPAPAAPGHVNYEQRKPRICLLAEEQEQEL